MLPTTWLDSRLVGKKEKERLRVSATRIISSIDRTYLPFTSAMPDKPKMMSYQCAALGVSVCVWMELRMGLRDEGEAHSRYTHLVED